MKQSWNVLVLGLMFISTEGVAQRDRDPQPPRTPQCNGHRTGWCRDHYFHDGAWIPGAINEKRARLDSLPGLLADVTKERELAREIERRLQTQIEDLDVLIKTQKDSHDFLKSEVLNNAEESVRLFQQQSHIYQESVPSIVVLLRKWITRDEFIGFRISEIEVKLQDETDPTVIARLQFEFKILSEANKYQEQFATQTEFDEAVTKIAADQFDITTTKLSPETISMLREAARITNLGRTGGEILESIRVRLSEHLQAVIMRIAATEGAIRGSNAKRESLKSQLDAQSVVVAAFIAKAASLEGEKSALPSSIQICVARLDQTNSFWRHCGSHPHCEALPDADQNIDKYRDFERRVVGGAWVEACR